MTSVPSKTLQSGSRSPARRKLDVLSALDNEHDVWLASARDDGRPHMVPLSFCWDGRHVIVQVRHKSRTAQNVIASRRARLALGSTRDVVLIDAAAEWVWAIDAPAVTARYRARIGWDAGPAFAQCVFLLLVPTRVQAWRELDEFAGRTLMQGGQWVV